MLELGLFDETSREVGTIEVAPRTVLLDALNRSLPGGEPDLVLVRVWRLQHGITTTYQIEDTQHGAFSALARTTAFPATALADLIAKEKVHRPGVFSMSEAVIGPELLPELEAVGIVVETL